jgi:hypothetical protein
MKVNRIVDHYNKTARMREECVQEKNEMKITLFAICMIANMSYAVTLFSQCGILARDDDDAIRRDLI